VFPSTANEFSSICAQKYAQRDALAAPITSAYV